MQGHVIVCGLQGVGLRAVEQFALSGTQVVVIDDDADPRRWRTLHDWGVPHVRRHAHRGEGFEEAGLARAAAVVCVEVDEIHTLETALRIKEIRPDLPLVVQLANPSVAHALERVSGPGSVLDVASLAAPSFVEACLLRPSHAIELAGIDFAVVQLGGRFEREQARHLPRPLRAPGPRGDHALRRRADGAVPRPRPPAPYRGPGRRPRHGGRVATHGHLDDPAGRRPDALHRVGPPRPAADRHRARGGQPRPGRRGHRAARADCGGDRRAALRLPSRRRPLPPRLPLFPVLHRGDRGDRRLRGLQLLPPEPVAHRVRHRPDHCRAWPSCRPRSRSSRTFW